MSGKYSQYQPLQTATVTAAEALPANRFVHIAGTDQGKLAATPATTNTVGITEYEVDTDEAGNVIIKGSGIVEVGERINASQVGTTAFYEYNSAGGVQFIQVGTAGKAFAWGGGTNPGKIGYINYGEYAANVGDKIEVFLI